jgi:hypothetical protein
MSMRRVAAILALLALATATPSAAAGATWSPPVDVSSPSNFIDSPFIGFGRSGDGLAAWRWQEGIGAAAHAGERVATVTTTGNLRPQQAAPPALIPPVIYGSGRVVLLDEATEIRRRRAPPLARLRISFGRTEGRFGPPRTIDTVEPFRVPALAANDKAQLAVAYIEPARDRRRIVKLALRRRKRFGRPQVVGRHHNFQNVTVAVGSRGDLVVAWARGRRVEARIRRPGHPLGPVVQVGTSVGDGVQLHAAVAATGRAWIVWNSQRVGEVPGPSTLRSSVSSPNRSKFRRPSLLDRFDRRYPTDVPTFDFSLDANDNGVVAWSTYDGQNYRLRLGLADRRGRFIRFATLSQAGYDAFNGDLATSKNAGEALVVWNRLDAAGEVGTAILAGYLSPSGVYGGEEQVSRDDRARVPAVAFNSRTDLPTVVWSQREGPDGPGVPLEQVHTFLRASTRTP